MQIIYKDKRECVQVVGCTLGSYLQVISPLSCRFFCLFLSYKRKSVYLWWKIKNSLSELGRHKNKKAMKPNKKTINLAQEYGFETAEYLYSRDGYDVFTPANNVPDEETPIIGEPIYIIQKGETSYTWQGIGEPLLLDRITKKR